MRDVYSGLSMKATKVWQVRDFQQFFSNAFSPPTSISHLVLAKPYDVYLNDWSFSILNIAIGACVVDMIF